LRSVIELELRGGLKPQAQAWGFFYTRITGGVLNPNAAVGKSACSNWPAGFHDTAENLTLGPDFSNARRSGKMDRIPAW
jgi:hypothetical protein